ncbi:MAG: GHKL domain-containing protein [Proteobacteria bacterium]|nr:GHKL domain-containing protein [Pseudomonadota bacterium]MBU1685812.1 GHKL domain-containing protein [Pseudomonadota bacterium]
MTLRKEIFFTILISIVLLTAFIGLGQSYIVFPVFQRIEKEESLKDLQRIQAVINHEINRLESLATDWGAWDDTYSFVHDRNEGYVESNLIPSTYSTNQINALFIIDEAGHVAWGETRMDEESAPLFLPELPTTTFPKDHPLLTQAAKGIMNTAHGPMLIAAQPILTSMDNGPPRGTFIMGRFLSDELRIEFSNMINVDFDIMELICPEGLTNDAFSCPDKPCLMSVKKGTNPPSDSLLAEITDIDTPLVEEINDKHLHIYAIMDDISGKASLLLRVQITRTITALGRDVLSGTLVSTIASGLLILVILLEIIRHIVVTPIDRLTRHAIGLKNNGTSDARIPQTLISKNEIGILAREFDDMLAIKNKARKQLVEQSYYTGMAEMASGAMHNIRNGLTPLLVDIGLLKEEISEIPHEQMEKACKELMEATPPIERRELLQQYFSTAIHHLKNITNDAVARLTVMNHRISIIEKILYDQEQFTSSKRYYEQTTMNQLIENAGQLLYLERYAPQRISLESMIEVTGKIIVAKTALLHVLTNLLNNAAEAILQQQDANQGIITIKAFTVLESNTEFIHCTVTDNGIGINQENLTKIFERGYSTKSKETSGIGLHWCANTVTSLQGKLYAESPGPKRGATFHLLFPRFMRD